MSLLRFVSLFCMLALVFGGLPSRALAVDVALVLTNRPYGGGPEVGAIAPREVSRQLRAAGFRVLSTDAANASAMRRTAEEFRRTLASADVDRAVIVLSGSVVSDGRDSWFLGRSKRGETLNDLNVAQQGIALATLDRILSEYPGQSLMVVAPVWTNRRAPGAGLRIGLDGHLAGQGVTLLTGAGDDVRDVMQQILDPTGASLADLAARAPAGVVLAGYLPRHSSLGAQPNDEVQASGDAAYWSAVRDINTDDAYRAYLRRFPSGLFVAQARRFLQSDTGTGSGTGPVVEPVDPAKAAEDVLELSRADRRAVQRDLTVLGYNTRGIDGVFGRGTRGAIRSYQQDQGLATTGYLSRTLLRRLGADAAARRAVLEEQDRDYWQQTGVTGEAEDLRRYLERYPNGVFAQTARDELQALADAEDARAAYDWQLTQDEDTVEGYRDFIELYPNSRYAGEARRRIEALENTGATAAQIEQDRREEGAISNNPIARLLIEKALERLNLNPGPADGRFTDATRRAIKDFQRRAELPETGYVSQQTMSRLTSASLR
jgi:peptidoglycan hydrolase-like protein with peptidoglycan-binding domain